MGTFPVQSQPYLCPLFHSHSSHSASLLLNLVMDDRSALAHRVLDEEMLQTGIIYMDRKRKLLAEELGLPPTSKHKWLLSGNTVSKSDYSSDADSDAIGVRRWDEGEEDSANDSNSVAAEAGSSISVSNEADVTMDQACSSSYCVGSTSSSKNPVDSSESSMIYEEEDHIQGYGCPADCSCSECVLNFEDYTDREVEDVLLNNGVLPEGYVFSNGRWTLKQDVEPASPKMTIDKEFEQYFSTLML